MDKITWQAYEFEQLERHPNWFAVLWIFAAALIVTGIILKSYLLSVFILLAAGVIHLFALKQPILYNFTLTRESISVGERIYNLADFNSFWIFEYENGNVLSLEGRRIMSSHLHLPLASEVDLEAIRSLLAGSITEKEHEESLFDILARILKF